MSSPPPPPSGNGTNTKPIGPSIVHRMEGDSSGTSSNASSRYPKRPYRRSSPRSHHHTTGRYGEQRDQRGGGGGRVGGVGGGNSTSSGSGSGSGASNWRSGSGGGRNSYGYNGGRGGGGGGGRGGRGGGRGGGGRGRSRGGGGSSGPEEVINGPSDEDLMIEFMTHLRNEDPGAREIYQKYGNKRKVFVSKVRDYLARSRTGSGTTTPPPTTSSSSTPPSSDHPSSDPTTSSTTTMSTTTTTTAAATTPRPLPKNTRTNNRNIHTNKETHHRQHNNDDAEVDENMEQMVAELTVGTDDEDDVPLPPASPSTNDAPSPNRIYTGVAPTPTPTPKSTTTTTTNNTNTPATTTNNNTNSTQPQPQPQPTTTLPRWQTKRRLTRLSQQPGVLLANGMAATASGHPILTLSPRSELVATWRLPLRYLRERTLERLEAAKNKNAKVEGDGTGDGSGSGDVGKGGGVVNLDPRNLTVRDALRSLTVGLYRRGCTENGSSVSIVSKEVVPSDDDAYRHEKNDNNRNGGGGEYRFEIDETDGTIWGDVPFYTPRTPGNVVLRLYFEDDPRVTLATSQCVRVQVAEEDLEPTLRFVLSNFKAKKGTTNFSSVHSLASVLEQFTPRSGHGGGTSSGMGGRNGRGGFAGGRDDRLDGAGRATWGCICESRKVMDAGKKEYLRKKAKLEKAEEELKELQKKLEEQEGTNDNDGASTEVSGNGGGNGNASSLRRTSDSVAGEDEDSTAETEGKDEATILREKIGLLMGEKASNERKWREVQSAFASVLRSVLNNRFVPLLLKRDVVVKLRLEYELWCGFCECFAPNPLLRDNNSNDDDNRDHDDDNYDKNDDRRRRRPKNHHVPSCFSNLPHPVTDEHFRLCEASRARMQEEILGFVPWSGRFALRPRNGGGGSGTIEALSRSMKEHWNKEYAGAEGDTVRRKVRAKDLTEKAVERCDAFPRGTRVVVFGSSANGFGSPESDLDMCIQLPPSTTLVDTEDINGSLSMGKLAIILEESGMVDVNTDRLGARIPVVKFYCPMKTENGEDVLIECDVSMQNPLACINTALLRVYSGIIPEVRMLAAVVKKWAKSRNINNPSQHTLSSYGYILMLLYFLTTHEVTSNGDTINIHDADAMQRRRRDEEPPSRCTILPNLQWMDPAWLQSPPGTDFQELNEKPSNPYTTVVHPSEASYAVNTYFCSLSDTATLESLRRRLSCTPLCVGRLLASFFRFYAHEFDYKRHIVSLDGTTRRYGPVDREAKAETDGWKLYGQALCVEDPFESFYDVAHVLKPAHFQRTRREFATAYAKIWEAVEGKAKGKMEDLLDWICEDVERKDGGGNGRGGT